jgi:hypothetical protein
LLNDHGNEEMGLLIVQSTETLDKTE